MSERNGYPAGVPCWVDTWQADADAAASFYAQVFGWETDGPAGGPFMCRVRGRDVAFIAERPRVRAHLPVAWTTYVWVNDADETAARVEEAGGSVLIAPFESLDGGRIVVFADPSGAVLAAWQPGAHRGAQLVNEAGAWSWSHLYTRDPDGAKAFYGAVFGWETDTFGEGDDAVTMWRVPGFVGGEPAQPVSRDVVAGMAAVNDFPDGTTAHWRIDFWVDDVDATAATATELGGRAVVAPYDTPISRQAVLADPQGAVFGISEVPGGREPPDTDGR
jgi:predicted enzyme related to lactoylglutathione lyase